jgi:hypothetical protein
MAMPDPSLIKLSPQEVIAANQNGGDSPDLSKFRIISVMGEPHYSVVYGKAEAARQIMVNTLTGDVREPISESEARTIAAGSMHERSDIESVEFITKELMSGHHEYREKPLPAWAVTFKHPESVTAYVGANDGQIHAVRTNSWRAFDFLWMLHTMDFSGRDNINNYVLRTFSILGIITVLSGFLLYFTSSKTMRRLFRRR